MQFRDLKKQYEAIKDDIDKAVSSVINDSNFILGSQVKELEDELGSYVGRKHCITCANGTDALVLALMVMGIEKNDAVFVPDFTYIASASSISFVGATPIFVDIDLDTFNISPKSLETAIEKVKIGLLEDFNQMTMFFYLMLGVDENTIAFPLIKAANITKNTIASETRNSRLNPN